MFIDISYPYKESMAVYPDNPGFSLRRVQDMETGSNANVSLVTIGTHTGTHIDAPNHFLKSGKTIDQIPLEMMNGKAKLFDLRGYSEITQMLLSKYDIDAGDIIILKTNNSDIFQADSVLDNYTTLDYGAAYYLAEKRIKMVGIDYMTIEIPKKKRIQEKSVHGILLSNEVLIAETLCLRDVKEGVYHLYCFPLNIIGADGVPVRIVLSI